MSGSPQDPIVGPPGPEPLAAAAAAARKSVPERFDVHVDHDRCVGNGMCLEFATGVFAHNARRQAEVVDPEGDAAEDIIVAAENCPTAAIQLSDAATGEPYEV